MNTVCHLPWVFWYTETDTKWLTFCRSHFQNTIWITIIVLCFIFPYNLLSRTQYVSNGIGNGLAPNRHQAIILTNYVIVYTRIYASGGRLNIKMSSYQYSKSYCGDKTILRRSYLHNGISYTGKTTTLFWIGALTVEPAVPTCTSICSGNSARC